MTTADPGAPGRAGTAGRTQGQVHCPQGDQQSRFTGDQGVPKMEVRPMLKPGTLQAGGVELVTAAAKNQGQPAVTTRVARCAQSVFSLLPTYSRLPLATVPPHPHPTLVPGRTLTI